ncbi:MAG: hypothetical protein CL679_14990 [Bermanella sp.]|nr:hypothetical protein [Bermanella sp.]
MIACLALSACSPSSPEDKAGDRAGSPLSYSFTLSQQEFDALSPDEQFMVANKALSTMYRGLPADEFFDLTQGLDQPVVQYDNFINRTQVALQTKLKPSEELALEKDIFGIEDQPDTEEVDESIPSRFRDLRNNRTDQIFLAKAHTYPISHDQFVHWMSYFLANTIMFSPALEMDSTDNQDVQRVLVYLQESLASGKDIRTVIRGWLNNLSRWRVSRSPENHALEMFELYLGVFNDSPEEQQNTINGGIACNDLFLTDDAEDYQLARDTTQVGVKVPLKVFDQYIYDCEGLYGVVAGHPLLIPRVVEVISNYFLDGMSSEKKRSVVNDVLSTGPETFEDVFLAVMFSKVFLLESERPKTFEENAFNFLHAMHWTPRSSEFGTLGKRVFNNLLNSTSSQIAVEKMGWSAMDYKIGRTPFLPMDVLSFASYHQAIRESVLLNNRAFDGRNYPKTEDFTEALEPREPPFEIVDGGFYIAGTENLKPELDALTLDEFIDFVFLTAMGRKATAVEREDLKAIGETRDHLRYYENDDGVEVLSLRRGNGGDDELYEYWTDDFAEIMLDYMSRLPEFYYYRAVQ